MFYYRLNGFSVASEFMLPCTQIPGRGRGETRAEILVSSIQEPLDEFPFFRWLGIGAEGLLRSYDVGTGYLIGSCFNFNMHISKAGDAIVFDAKPENFREAAVLAIGIGISICAILQHRLPIHASCSEIHGDVVGFAATSGTGKTTTNWSLIDRGARFCSDDVTTLKNEGGRFMVSPSVSMHAKLSKKALDRRSLASNGLQEVLEGEQEYWVEIDRANRITEDVPLEALFLLEPYSPDTATDQVLIERISGAKTVPLLLNNIHGLWSVFDAIDRQGLLHQVTTLGKNLPIFSVRYRKRFDMLPVICDQIELLIRNL